MARLPKQLARIPDPGDPFQIWHIGSMFNLFIALFRSGWFLLEATDRVSFYGFVLNATIREQGEVVTALTHWWSRKLDANGIPHNLVKSKQCGRYNAAFDYKESGIDPRNYLMVEELELSPSELTFHLIHSSHTVCRTKTRLTTPADGYSLGKQAFELATQISQQRGLVLSRATLRTGWDHRNNLVLANALFCPHASVYRQVVHPKGILTFDQNSCRFDWFQLQKWAATVTTPFGVSGLQHLNPRLQSHQEFAQSLAVPDHLLKEASQQNLALFQQLTGYALRDYQEWEMGANPRFVY